MLGKLSCFCCHLLTFFPNNSFRKGDTTGMSQEMDPDHDQFCSSVPSLGPNCLQRLSADDKKVATSKERFMTAHKHLT